MPNQTLEAINKCDQTIRYYAGKLKGGEEEINAPIEVVISPSNKSIRLTGQFPNEEKQSVETVIESFDCNFNADLTEGLSFYKGYVKQSDGTALNAVIKVEAKNGAITISNATPERPDVFIIYVTKWEVVSE